MAHKLILPESTALSLSAVDEARALALVRTVSSSPTAPSPLKVISHELSFYPDSQLVAIHWQGSDDYKYYVLSENNAFEFATGSRDIYRLNERLGLRLHGRNVAQYLTLLLNSGSVSNATYPRLLNVTSDIEWPGDLGGEQRENALANLKSQYATLNRPNTEYIGEPISPPQYLGFVMQEDFLHVLSYVQSDSQISIARLRVAPFDTFTLNEDDTLRAVSLGEVLLSTEFSLLEFSSNEESSAT